MNGPEGGISLMIGVDSSNSISENWMEDATPQSTPSAPNDEESERFKSLPSSKRCSYLFVSSENEMTRDKIRFMSNDH